MRVPTMRFKRTDTLLEISEVRAAAQAHRRSSLDAVCDEFDVVSPSKAWLHIVAFCPVGRS